MKLIQIFLVLGLVLVGYSYTEENHVLILTADDFPGIIEEFPHILIEFYAPWCGHCKRLAPVYDEVAKELHDSGVPVRLAKIDADQHQSVKPTYGVQGFPTILFFSHGQQIKYNGQRSKQFMVNWLSKKTRPALISIEASKLEEIAAEDKVSIVVHGAADSASGKIVEELAVADDYNTYYAVTGSDKPEGTVEIYRPFGDVQSTQASSELKNWISTYERPTVYVFDERTISNIFGEQGTGIILFHAGQAGDSLAQAFNEAAEEVRVKQGKSALIFTGIPLAAEHYSGLANYIKIQPPKSPVVIIDGGKRVKFVMQASPAEVTSEQIVKFVEQFEQGNGKEYKMDEEVVYQDGSKVEEEL